jgi:hypothetical protein
MSTSAAKALASPPANPTSAAAPMASSSFCALSRFIGDEVKGSNKPPLLKPRLLAQPGFLFFKSYRRPGDIPNAHGAKVVAASLWPHPYPLLLC